ncbi:hypothetical protein GCM10009556_008550 [Acrocarpospora pleiomorpha]
MGGRIPRIKLPDEVTVVWVLSPASLSVPISYWQPRRWRVRAEPGVKQKGWVGGNPPANDPG